MRLSAVRAAFFGVACLVSGAANATCSPLPFSLTNGTVADANQVMANFNSLLNCINNSLVTLSGPLGPIGQYTAPTYQNQGTIATGTHNVAFTDANVTFGASFLQLVSGDQSQRMTATFGTVQSGDTVSGSATILGAAANPYTWNYTVVGGDTTTSVGVGYCKAMLNNSAFIAALAAFQPTNTYTIPIGYYPVQAANKGADINGGCAAQVAAGVFAFDFPAEKTGGNSISASKSGGGTTTVSLVNNGLDGGSQLQAGRFFPGRNNAAGDLGAWLSFQGQANSASTGLDRQIANIVTKFTAADSVTMRFETLQGGSTTQAVSMGAGMFMPPDASCGTDPGHGNFLACNLQIPSTGAFTISGAGFINNDGSGNLQINNNVAGSLFLTGASGHSAILGTNGGAASLTISATNAFIGPVSTNSTTDSTSTVTGSFTTPGGGGIGKALFVGGAVSVTDATQSTSTTTGSIKTVGGLAVVKDAFIGGGINVAGSAFLGGNIAVTGTLAVTQGSPASGAACTAGHMEFDAGFMYNCPASGAWRRVATTGGY